MADALDLLLYELRKYTWANEVMKRTLDDLQRFKAASQMERALVHGPFIDHAAGQVFRVLLDHYSYAGHKASSWDLLQHAARNCDPDLCSTIVNVMEVDSIEGGLAKRELAELMFICTSVACQNRDLNLAIKMMQFAISVGCDINNLSDVLAPGNQKPLFVVIDSHQADLLDWMLENTQLSMDIFDAEGNNPLHRLIESGFSSSFDISKLLKKGADPNAMN